MRLLVTLASLGALFPLALAYAATEGILKALVLVAAQFCLGLAVGVWLR